MESGTSRFDERARALAGKEAAMSEWTPPEDGPSRPPRRPPASGEDGIELSDEQLEFVVGGLEPEAWKSMYSDYLQEVLKSSPK